jgi:hypothetical protein
MNECDAAVRLEVRDGMTKADSSLEMPFRFPCYHSIRQNREERKQQ